MAKMQNLSRRNKRWTSTEERNLCELKLIQNKSFKEIEGIMLRSERALKLRFCFIVDSIDWSTPKTSASPPVAVDVADDVCRLILDGSTPLDIALQYPRFFILNHEGIIRLYENLARKPWRPFQ
jgi:hypothetical protein